MRIFSFTTRTSGGTIYASHINDLQTAVNEISTELSNGIGSVNTTYRTFKLSASVTAAASLNIPSGVAPTTPVSGDIWNASGVLKLYDGTNTKSLAYLEGAAFTGNVSTTGTLQVDGNTTLGDALTDTVTVGGNVTFPATGAHSIQQASRTSGTVNGDNLSLYAGSAFGTNKNGGQLALVGGAGTGTGYPGNIVFYTYTNSGATSGTTSHSTLTARLVVSSFDTVQAFADFDVFTAGDVKVFSVARATGNTAISGDLTVQGNTTLGDASTDSLTINAATLAFTNNASHVIGINNVTGTDTQGKQLTIQSGQGTGTATTSNIVFSTPEKTASSGTTTQTLDTRLTIGTNTVVVGGSATEPMSFRMNGPACTVTAGAAAGTGRSADFVAPASGSTSNTSMVGHFHVATGSSTTTGAFATVTFPSGQTRTANRYHVFLQAVSTNFAALQPYISQRAAGSFSVGVNVAPTANDNYYVSYLIIDA